MAGTSLLALIDDIAGVLDDVALLSKVAARKTAGVLGDDLALNAQQVAGLAADRELPVVWAVAVGSLKNKAILVPSALAVSALASWAVMPLLMLGGAYLCYEGVEKLAHQLLHGVAQHEASHGLPSGDTAVDWAAVEREKIQGAIRTDFILSAEIIVIALGTVAAAPFGKQVLVLAAVAVLMTVGAYGLVAGIVKLDDGALYLSRRTGTGRWPELQRGLGGWLLLAAPWLMKGLSMAGTLAMFLVGGGILVHAVPFLAGLAEAVAQGATHLSWAMDMLVGMAAGALVLAVVELAERLRH